MPVIKNKILPIGKRYFAINLFGIIFAKGDCNAYILNHEKIHTRQMLELLIIPFYIWYVVEWLIRLLLTRNTYKAYSSISFEREAYAHEKDFDYLNHRRAYSFRGYIFKSKGSASFQTGNLSR